MNERSSGGQYCVQRSRIYLFMFILYDNVKSWTIEREMERGGKTNGNDGHQSLYLTHAKRMLHQLSNIPDLIHDLRG